MNNHDKYDELAAGYALGALDEHDRHRFEFHLASGCTRCDETLREAQQVTCDLVLALSPVAPRPQLRDKLLRRIRMDAPEAASEAYRPEQPRRGNWLSFALAASILLAIGLGYQTYTLEQRVQTVQRAYVDARNQLVELRSSVDVLSAPQTQTVSLRGQGPTPGAKAKAFIDPAQRRLFLYVYDLPPTPPGKTYQLWLLVGGKPVSAGLFNVTPDGSARFIAQELAPFSGAVNVAVTIEPEGGVPQPTGSMVLLGL